jgi:phage-related minor tail protein
MFRFGQGGSRLGVMGEAGPEAIMPLARDSSGTLGVRTVGSGSYAAPAPRTIVMIENHGSGADPQVTRQSQPNGDEMIRVVLNAAANDVSRGGPLRKSIKSTLRTSPNLPRY